MVSMGSMGGFVGDEHFIREGVRHALVLIVFGVFCIDPVCLFGCGLLQAQLQVNAA